MVLSASSGNSGRGRSTVGSPQSEKDQAVRWLAPVILASAPMRFSLSSANAGGIGLGAEDRGHLEAGVFQFLGGVAREGLKKRQAAAGIADDQGFGRGRFAPQARPGSHERDHGAVIVEQPACGE